MSAGLGAGVGDVAAGPGVVLGSAGGSAGVGPNVEGEVGIGAGDAQPATTTKLITRMDTM
jgi:hypothetical protein